MTCKWLPFVTITYVYYQPSYYPEYCFFMFYISVVCVSGYMFHITEAIKHQGFGRGKYFPRNSYGRITFDFFLFSIILICHPFFYFLHFVVKII